MKKLNSLFETSIASSLGIVKIIWRESPLGSEVHRIILPNDERIHDGNLWIERLDHIFNYPVIEKLACKIRSFLEGQEVEFDLTTLDLARCQKFQLKVLLAEYAIPRGYVTTYGRIARHLGITKGARAVGVALSYNPFPLVIPCHRAIRSNGELGGFQGGVKMKESLLRMEGVLFHVNGRVIMDKIYY